MQHQTNNPENPFWQTLDQQIKQIKQRHRPRNIPVNSSIQQSSSSVTHNRFLLEAAWHREQNETLTISNRLKYLQGEKQRQKKALQSARRKFQYMMTLRQRSLKQKQGLKQKKEEFHQQAYKVNLEVVNKIRQQRSRTSLSMRRSRMLNEKDANEVRNLNFEIRKTIKNQKQVQINNKRQQVQKNKERVAKSRIMLSQIQKEKIEQGKIDFEQTMQKKFQANESQRKRNSYLKKKLKVSIEQVEKRKRSVIEKLKEYQWEE